MRAAIHAAMDVGTILKSDPKQQNVLTAASVLNAKICGGNEPFISGPANH
jgi:hypothetical protein